MNIKQGIFLLLFFIAFSGCFDDDIEQSIIANNNAKNTKITLTTIDNQEIVVTNNKNIWSFEGKNLKNKIILVNFWATWCPPCRVEIPHFLNIRAKYKDNFEIIGVLMEQDKNKNSLRNFANQYKITYPITTSFQNFLLSDAMGGARGLPTSYLIDTKGKIVQIYQGAIPSEMLNKDIENTIKDNN